MEKEANRDTAERWQEAGTRHRLIVTPPRGELGAGAEPIHDPLLVEAHLRDASGRVGRGEALFLPSNEAQVAEILRQASRQGVAVDIVAGQSSTTASSVPDGGWILSTERLVDGVEIDPARLRARARTGNLLGEFQDELDRAALLYPPDPTSRYECTLGGSIACNASGPRSFRYGATRRWVRGLRVVLASGHVIAFERGQVVSGSAQEFEIVDEHGETIARIPIPTASGLLGVKDVGPYGAGCTSPDHGMDLVDLFIGSEGTLGVATEVEVDLVPRPPGWLDFLVSLPGEGEALDVVESLRAEPLGSDADSDLEIGQLCCIEYFDAACLDLLRESQPGLPVPADARAALFLEFESAGDAELDARLIEALHERLTRHGAPGSGRDDEVLVAQTAAQREALRLARHAIPVGVNERAARNGMPKLGTDLAVPDAALRAMFDLYRRAARAPRALLEEAEVASLLREVGAGNWDAAGLPASLEAFCFGHIGDNHVHVNFLPRSPVELALARAVYAHLTRRAIELGGSPSAEHGYGKTKHEALEELLGPEALDSMRALKRSLDPAGILGRGNLFPPNGPPGRKAQ